MYWLVNDQRERTIVMQPSDRHQADFNVIARILAFLTQSQGRIQMEQDWIPVRHCTKHDTTMFRRIPDGIFICEACICDERASMMANPVILSKRPSYQPGQLSQQVSLAIHERIQAVMECSIIPQIAASLLHAKSNQSGLEDSLLLFRKEEGVDRSTLFADVPPESELYEQWPEELRQENDDDQEDDDITEQRPAIRITTPRLPARTMEMHTEVYLELLMQTPTSAQHSGEHESVSSVSTENNWLC